MNVEATWTDAEKERLAEHFGVMKREHLPPLGYLTNALMLSSVACKVSKADFILTGSTTNPNIKKAFATMEDELKDEMVNVRRVDHQLCLLNNMRFVFLNDPATTSEAKDKSRVLLSFRDYILSKQSEWSSNSITPCSKWAIKRKAELSPPKPANNSKKLTKKSTNKKSATTTTSKPPPPAASTATGRCKQVAASASSSDGTQPPGRRRGGQGTAPSGDGETPPAKIPGRRDEGGYSAAQEGGDVEGQEPSGTNRYQGDGNPSKDSVPADIGPSLSRYAHGSISGVTRLTVLFESE
jgi:hypothetical protein